MDGVQGISEYPSRKNIKIWTMNLKLGTVSIWILVKSSKYFEKSKLKYYLSRFLLVINSLDWKKVILQSDILLQIVKVNLHITTLGLTK